jgi:uncharacterized protein YehS (DUF1456 family)
MLFENNPQQSEATNPKAKRPNTKHPKKPYLCQMALTNNDIFKKLRVALKLRDDDIVKILELVDFRITKSELGAFFRSEDHPKYKNCGDQILRNFLNGLVIHMRGPMPKKDDKSKTKPSTPPSSKRKERK